MTRGLLRGLQKADPGGGYAPQGHLPTFDIPERLLFCRRLRLGLGSHCADFQASGAEEQSTGCALDGQQPEKVL